jgi:transcriptional regulator with XRE-family HTH domain
MEDRRVGRIVREVRVRKVWRQSDLAEKVGVSQRTISEIELGRLEQVNLGTLRRVARGLDISIGLNAWWRSGEVDRLLDSAHAALVDHVIAQLQSAGWIALAEVTFNQFGDRGSADIVAWHPTRRVLLIIEVKTRINDVQETLSSIAKKVRVLPDVLAKEQGWRPVSVGRVLVLADTSTNRRIVEGHRALFISSFPMATAAVKRLIRGGSTTRADADEHAWGGRWFVRYDAVGSGRTPVRQVLRVRSRRRRRIPVAAGRAIGDERP